MTAPYGAATLIDATGLGLRSASVGAEQTSPGRLAVCDLYVPGGMYHLAGLSHDTLKKLHRMV